MHQANGRARQVPGVVREGEAGAKLANYVGDKTWRQAVFAQGGGAFVGRVHHLAQALAVHVLHGDVGRVLNRAHLINLHDVRVAQLGRHPRLRKKHVDVFLLALARLQEPFDHHQLLEARGPGELGQVDLAHAAGGDAAQELVFAKIVVWSRHKGPRVGCAPLEGQTNGACPTSLASAIDFGDTDVLL